MDILIFSDTHGRADRILDLLEKNDSRHVIFLGDGLRDLDEVPLSGREVYAVRGNSDRLSGDVPSERIELFEGYRIFFTHGHEYSVKWGVSEALLAAAKRGADVLLHGHTHTRFERRYERGYRLPDGTVLEKPVLVLCPGALSEYPASFATLTLKKEGALAGFGVLYEPSI